jgi:hypothetical protein
MSGTTRRHEDVERIRTRPNRRSPAAVSRTLDPAKRKATIAELRELVEKVERRWRSERRRGTPRCQRPRDVSAPAADRQDEPCRESRDVRTTRY